MMKGPLSMIHGGKLSWVRRFSNVICDWNSKGVVMTIIRILFLQWKNFYSKHRRRNPFNRPFTCYQRWLNNEWSNVRIQCMWYRLVSKSMIIPGSTRKRHDFPRTLPDSLSVISVAGWWLLLMQRKISAIPIRIQLCIAEVRKHQHSVVMTCREHTARQ